ncbi:MAG: type II toxin-antitoxin system RelE/ParE family toxin [Acidobacteriota bacterium]
MAYAIEILPSAQRELKKLNPTERRRIAAAIQKLGENPRPDGVKKLKSPDPLYRIRIGSRRVIYWIEDRKLKVLVIQIALRKDAYRRL